MRSSALRRRNWVRRTMTSIWWSIQCVMNPSSGSVRGTPSTIASMFAPKFSCSWVCLYRLFSTTLATASRFKHDHETLTGAVRRLVADVGDAGDLALAGEVADLDGDVVGVDLVRQLGDHQARAALDLLDVHDGAHRDRAAAGAVGVLDAAGSEDLRASREVRARDALHERLEQLFARRIGVLERPEGAGGDLAQVVRRDVGRHADRDADRAVDQQVREPRRQDDGLLGLAVVVVLEVDGVFFDVAHHLERERGHLGLGVPRGGRALVAGGAEVALPERERVAQRPRLHEPDEGVVDRGVTVRVVLTHDLADDAGALARTTCRDGSRRRTCA